MKQCKKCSKEKLFTEFHKGSRNKDGYRPYCKECINNTNRLEYDSNKAKSKYNYEKDKNFKLKRTFGMSYQEYLNMLAAQQGCCAICGTNNPGVRAFAVDHCHNTGAIRGLLCGKCNTGIGSLQDDINILQRAIQYLENSKGK